MTMPQKLTDKVYTFYHDPGHGWLKVYNLDLNRLGLSVAQHISNYSYQRREKSRYKITFIPGCSCYH